MSAAAARCWKEYLVYTDVGDHRHDCVERVRGRQCRTIVVLQNILCH